MCLSVCHVTISPIPSINCRSTLQSITTQCGFMTTDLTLGHTCVVVVQARLRTWWARSVGSTARRGPPSSTPRYFQPSLTSAPSCHRTVGLAYMGTLYSVDTEPSPFPWVCAVGAPSRAHAAAAGEGGHRALARPHGHHTPRPPAVPLVGHFSIEGPISLQIDVDITRLDLR